MENPVLAEVSYSKSLRKITCLRFVCSKIIYEPEKIKTVELIILYDLLLWSQDKALADGSFRNKFGNSLEVLSKIVKNFRLNLKVDRKILARKLKIKFESELQSFIFPVRNYPSVKQKMSGNYHLKRSTQPGTENSKLPPVGYIGKGYRDKGSARNPTLDGSPSWQQIASSGYFQLKMLLEKLTNDKHIKINEKIKLIVEASELFERLESDRAINRVRSEKSPVKSKDLQS